MANYRPGMTPSRPLADRLAEGATVLMPGVWDPLSALIAVQAGFDTLFVSGFAVSASLLGEPDHGILSQSEMAEVAGRIGHRLARLDTPVDLIVDADTGYGDATDIRRTVELWEAAGATGLFLEDQVWPKRCGHMEGKQVVSTDEWLDRLRVVLECRERLFVCARTDARAPLGLDQAIERGCAARDLGVDAVFVEAPQSIDELREIASAITGLTLVANMVEGGRTPLLTPEELAEIGFTMVVSPLSGLLAMSASVGQALATLHGSGSMRGSLDSLTGFDAFVSLVSDSTRA